MAAQNIIDVSWDIENFDLQTQAVIARMEQVFQKANQGASAAIAPGSTGGYTEITKKITEFNSVQENTLRLTKLQEQAEQARLRTQKLTQDAIAAEAKARTANATATIKEAQAKEQAAKSAGITTVNGGSRDSGSQEATAEQTEEFKRLRQAEADASIGAAEYGQSVNAGTGDVKDAAEADMELEKARLAVTKANSEQNVELQGLNAQKQLANKAAKEEALNALGLLGPYQQLSKSYAAASLNAKDLAVQFGVNSVEAKEAADTALALNTQLQTIDKTVGESQKNVGNYTSALNPASKAISNLTNISSLAGTAISRLRRQFVGFFIGALSSSLILPAIQMITELVQSIFDMGKASKEVLQQQQDIAEAFKTAADGAAEEISKVTVLKTVLDSENTSREQKITALKDLKEINIDYFGQLDIENGKVNGLESSYDAYIQKLIRSINVKANIEELTTALKGQNEVIGDINKNSEAGFKHTINNLTEYERRNAIAQYNLTFDAKKGQSVSLSPKQDQLIVDLLNKADLVKEITNRMKGDIQDAFDPKKPPKVAKGKTTLESTKTQLDLEFELYKIDQARKIKLLDEEANNTKRTFEDRLSYAKDYYDASVELVEKTAQHEINQDKIKLNELQANFAKAKGTEKNNISIDIENQKKQIVIAIAKKNDDIIGFQTELNNRQDAIAKDEVARQKKAIEDSVKSIDNIHAEQKSAIDAIRASELASHDELLKKKAISQDKYDKLEKESIKQSLIATLKADLLKEESLRNLAKLQGESTVLLDNEIIKLKGEIKSADKKDTKDNGLKKPGEYLQDIAQSGQDLATGLVDIKYQKEQDAIQRIIDLNNFRKDQEIANINASTLSNQEKASQMIVLDNAVAANNRKLEREKVAIQIKQAKFDRDMAVLTIIEQAAIALIKLPAQAGFAGIAAGIAIGVEAAAQIAMILAKPLPVMPQYASGTLNHPGGPAIVGEGRFKELVQSENGSFIADRPMLLNNLPKGSKVIPLTSDVINEVMYNAMIIGTAQRLQAGTGNNKSPDREIIEAIENGSRMTVQAMKKQRGANVVVNVNGSWGAYITKSVIE